MNYDTELIDWELPPNDERKDAAWFATTLHGKLHPDRDPVDCKCAMAWRRNPSFAGVLAALRAMKRRATRALSAAGYDASGREKDNT